jgi:sulfonate transport system substrate-binding protein
MRHGARQLAIDPEAAQQDAFFLASRSFAERYPDAVAAINADVTAAAAYAGTHREEAAALYAAATGVDLASETRTVGRSDFVVGPITAETVTRQQAVADRFARIHLIPGPVKVADIVWTHAPGG